LVKAVHTTREREYVTMFDGMPWPTEGNSQSREGQRSHEDIKNSLLEHSADIRSMALHPPNPEPYTERMSQILTVQNITKTTFTTPRH
jgi:hypothetical protein